MRHIGTRVGVECPWFLDDSVEAPSLTAFNSITKPDPQQIQTWHELREALQLLKLWAGNVSLRRLSRRCAGSPTAAAFSQMLLRENVATGRMVVAYIFALGLESEVEEWVHAWYRVMGLVWQG